MAIDGEVIYDEGLTIVDMKKSWRRRLEARQEGSKEIGEGTQLVG